MLKRTHFLATALLLTPGIAVARNITGTNGDDVLIGTPKADYIQGFDGYDTIEGRGGDDVIDGGANGDTIIWRVGDGNDTIDGGPSDSDNVLQATASGFTRPVTLTTTIEHGRLVVRPGPGQGSVTAIRIGIANVAGGSGNDTLIVGDVSKPPQWLQQLDIGGGPGNDLIDASKANAAESLLALLGGSGNDIIKSGAGDYVIIPGSGNDTVYTGSGVNSIQLSAHGLATLHLGSGSNGIGSEVEFTRFSAVIYGFNPDKNGVQDDRLSEDDLQAFDTNKNGLYDAGDKAVKVQGGNLSVDFYGTHVTFMGFTSIPVSAFVPGEID